MNDKRYQWILYTITTVIVITIGIQAYWNYHNYQQNNQQVMNDIQLSLDKAVENYYSQLSKENYFTLVRSYDECTNFNNEEIDSTTVPFKTKDTINQEFSISAFSIDSDDFYNIDSLDEKFISKLFDENDSIINQIDTISKKIKSAKFTQLSNDKSSALTFTRDSSIVEKNTVFWGKKASDSLKLIQGLSTIFVAFQQDSLDYKKLDSLLISELNNKGIKSDYYLHHLVNKDTLFSSKSTKQPTYGLKKNAASTYLKNGESVILNFEHPVLETFKRSTLGLILSMLLVLGIVSCLFYLLKIIKHQKQLAEVKNDLISNITHEFKTPIATIGVVLESINNFNVIDDKEKTKKYINMSSEQLGKLNIMVEKLLETATLDSDNLELNKETVDVVVLLNDLTQRYKIQFPEKEFNASLKVKKPETQLDVFHFENAINNILDNAVKYGGKIISVDLIPQQNSFDILISDNGNTLSKANKDRIFEKFYRIPKGNTHDVKGFGIGLYYTKTIIEKHNGSIDLNLAKDLTTFKITLPNG